ncbi:potassium channel family protein [Caenimonas sp. DR4.4]|uniref:Potassium channel family protein n=1 Tax=Caenimonas aquaedulcis TaxID=2793270 RepID=A0A931H956_9BURK|nr:potassium channel family protein [Caenimonas aquaedulcis]
MLVLVHLVGTLGYHYIGRPAASWIDSFYMTFITVATIGYGETVDLSAHPLGRLFTVGIAIVGIGTMSYLFSTLVALLLESDLNAALRKRHMQRQIADMHRHYIICGVGRVGSNVAEELRKTQRDFVVIEIDSATIERWLDRAPDTLYLQDDASSDDALLRAGVMRAAGVFAVTGDDSHNLMIALSVKLLNPATRVVARLHDIRNAGKARKAGADEIVSPDFTGGMRIASAMVRPHVVNFMDQMLRAGEGLRVEEVVLPSHKPPRALGALVPKSRHYMLMATHEHGQWVFNPGDEYVVQPGAALILMATPQGRRELQERLEA